MASLIINTFILMIIIFIFAFAFRVIVVARSRKQSPRKYTNLSSKTLTQIKNNAIRHQESGNLNECIRLYEIYLKRYPDDIDARLSAGKAYIDTEKIKKAQEHFKYVIKEYPNDPEGYKLLGDSYLLTKDYKSALTQYQSAIKISPDNIEARYMAFAIYHNFGDRDACIYELQSIVQYNGLDVNARKLLANLYAEKKDFLNAANEYKTVILMDNNVEIKKKYVEVLNEAGICDEELDNLYIEILKADEDNVEIMTRLGESYIKKGAFDNATEIYTKAAECNNENVLIKNRLAQVLLMNGDLDKSIWECISLMLHNPEFDEPKLTLIEAYKLKGMFEDAAKIYKYLIIETLSKTKQLEYILGLSNLLCEWGNKLIEENKYQESIDKFIEALQHDDANCLAYSGLGRANHAIRNFSEAISSYKKVIELSEADCNVYLKLGHMYDEIDEPMSAITYYIDAVQLEPDNFDARYILAKAYLKLGIYNEAATELRKVLSFGIDQENVQLNLARAYECNGQYNEAKEFYYNVLTLNPKNAEARTNLARILEAERDAIQVNKI